MKDWDYAQLTKVASENGGPQKFIDKVADTNFNMGYNTGHDSGVKDGVVGAALIFGGIALIYAGGKWIFNKIQEHKEHEDENRVLKKESDEAKKEYVEAMGTEVSSEDLGE